MTRRYLFSGSAVGRSIECTASCILPWSKETGDPTARDGGVNVHGFVDRARLVGRDAALAEMDPSAPGYEACVNLDIDAIPIDYMIAQVEIPLAYDYVTDTARVLVDASGSWVKARNYRDAVPPLRETEIPTTLDALEYGGGEIVVSDLKTGQFHAGYREQIVLGVLAASRLYNDPAARLIGQLIFTRELDRPMRWEVSDGDLTSMREQIAAAFARAEEWADRAIERGDVNPGEACAWCRAKERCPSRIEAARELAKMQPNALAEFRALIRTDEGKREAWKRLPAFEELVASMRSELDAAVIASPVDLPDGSTLGAVRTERRRVADANAVRQVLAETCGEEAANSAVEVSYSTSIGAIEKAAGKAKREVIAALENSGAIQTATTVRAGVSRAKKGRAA